MRRSSRCRSGILDGVFEPEIEVAVVVSGISEIHGFLQSNGPLLCPVLRKIDGVELVSKGEAKAAIILP